jgi:hypothetical protein
MKLDVGAGLRLSWFECVHELERETTNCERLPASCESAKVKLRVLYYSGSRRNIFHAV